MFVPVAARKTGQGIMHQHIDWKNLNTLPGLAATDAGGKQLS
jgi:hypothetical protein